MAERRPPRPFIYVPEGQEPMTFFEVLDQLAADYPGIVLMNPNDVRVKPAPVERVRTLAQISVDDPNAPEMSEILARMLFDRRWSWGFERPFGYIAIVERHPQSGLHRIVMKEIQEGLPVGRPEAVLGAAKRSEPLEKARTDAFLQLLADVTGMSVSEVKRSFVGAGIRTYAEFLEKIEVRGREIEAASGSPLDPANGLASFELMTSVLDVEPVDLVKRLGVLGLSNLAYISSFVLEKGAAGLTRKGKGAYESARPVTQKTYTAFLLDQWPDSPAAIADFWLTDQRRYDALYFPVRASEITIEQLDRALGDPEALTRLANASPSNPHKGVVFGWEATMNRTIEVDG